MLQVSDLEVIISKERKNRKDEIASFRREFKTLLQREVSQRKKDIKRLEMRLRSYEGLNPN